VTSIGFGAFIGCTSLTNVTIPNSVTTIGEEAFDNCTSLTSVTIPNSVTSLGRSAFYYCTSLTNVTIGNGVTNIDNGEFAACTSLSSVTIGNGVTNIAYEAFFGCSNLNGVYFKGNTPGTPPPSAFFDSLPAFFNDTNATAYYLPGTTGWSTNFAGLPTALWTLPYPLILNNSLGIQSNRFGFTVSWATNLSVLVEAAIDLANPVWSPLATNVLTGGSFYFADPRWTNYPKRFYRVRSQ
jgi:hypothetical protein